jgi:hypothetical protein
MRSVRLATAAVSMAATFTLGAGESLSVLVEPLQQEHLHPS